jgi:3-hydroxyisobutyrate dehydrogenase-like beta-hydroxyacid dehydrogenase
MIHGFRHEAVRANMFTEIIGILHPGQMGAVVAATAKNAGHEVHWASEGRSPETRHRAESIGIRDAGSLSRLCSVCSVIISVCPPEFAEEVARSVVREGFRGLFVEANAVSPDRARGISQVIKSAGADCVDGCIIGLPTNTPGETWMYLSGECAETAAACFRGGPLEVEVLSEDIGRASALKMCFAAYSKGSAALRAAVVGAAESLGVLAPLERQWSRSDDWARAQKSIRQVSPKAWRFVAEMHEIAATFESAGMPPGFHLAAAEIFTRLASFKGADAVELADVLEKLGATSTAAESHKS